MERSGTCQASSGRLYFRIAHIVRPLRARAVPCPRGDAFGPVGSICTSRAAQKRGSAPPQLIPTVTPGLCSNTPRRA